MTDEKMDGKPENCLAADAAGPSGSSGDALDDDGFARRVRSTMEGYAPRVADELREEMWREIRARRSERSRVAEPEAAPARGASPTPLALETGWRRVGPVFRGLAAAAVVVAAFGLGWISARNTPGQSAGGDPGMSVAPTDGPYSNAWTYMPRATEHLVEAEMLLVLFASDSTAADPGGVRRWARSLLGTTRLLLDSDAGRHPTLAEPLRDLELVLVQIANLGDDGNGSERDFIYESLRERHVLEKIRAASEAGLDQETAD